MMNLTTLEVLSVKELCGLDVSELSDLSKSMQALMDYVKMMQEKLEDCMHIKFYDKALQKLSESGKETGTARFDEEGYVIAAEIPKKVSWDQKVMEELCEKLPDDRRKDLVKSTYSIDERPYNVWPDDIKKYFDKAKSVSVGKTKFQILEGAQP